MKADEMKIFRLEDRILFEAAAAAEVVDAVQNDPGVNNTADAEDKKSNEIEAVLNAPVENGNTTAGTVVDPADTADIDAQLNALIEGVIPQETQNDPVAVQLHDSGLTVSTGKELVVIDDSVKDIDSILAELSPDQDILILEKDNGLDELNDYLDSQDTVYSAIHFVTHGSKGEISINGDFISSENFDSSEWSKIGEHLTADGDLLFYGCEIAESEDGQTLLEQISAASDADVAASIDRTGLSGNWDLEYTTANIDTAVLTVDDYSGDLTEKSVSTYTELFDALNEAATNGGEYTITINNNIDFSGQDEILLNFDKATNLTIKSDGKVITGTDGFGIFSFININTDSAVSVSVSIENIVFTDGGSATADLDETALYAMDIDLLLKDSTFRNFDNGAVYAVSLDPAVESLSVVSSKFLNNRTSGDGGAINTVSIDLAISSNSYFSGNSAAYGGAVSLEAGSATITNTTFYNNNAENGGAVYMKTGTLDISNSTFYQNSAKDDGGAISMFDEYAGYSSITDTTFAANTAGGDGGAIYNNKGTLTICNSLLIGEGGSVLYQDSNGKTTVSYSLITSAKAADDGVLTIETTTSEVNAAFTEQEVFGDNTYDTVNHTITPDAFHKAAWCGTDTTNAKDQLGHDRNSINDTLDTTDKFTVGAVTAQAGILVTQNDATVTYTGEIITPNKNNVTIKYADGTDITKRLESIGAPASSPSEIRNVGDYVITPSEAVITGLTATNAIVKYTSGKLTVKKATLVITVADQADVTYGTGVSPTYSSNGLMANDTITGELAISGEKSTSGNWIVGTHDITQGTLAVDDGNGGNNYLVSFVGDSFNVEKLGITIGGITADNRVYDGTKDVQLNTTGATFTTMVAGDILNVTTTGTMEDKNADTGKTVTLGTLVLGGADANNYSINADSQTTTTVNIAKANLTITVDDQADITYGTAVAPTYTSTVLAPGDTITGELAITGNKSTSGNWIVGTHDITQGTLTVDDGNGGNNYLVSFVGDSFNVEKLGITIGGITADNRVYDGTKDVQLNTTGATFTTMVAGDILNVTTTGTMEDKNADTGKTVTLGTLVLGGADANNYSINADSQTTTTVNIAKANLTITVDDQADITYGTAVAPTYTSTVLAPGDTITGELAITGNKSTSGNWIVGTHDITQGTLAVNDGNNGNNYELQFNGDSFTVNKLGVTVGGITAVDRFYDGTKDVQLNTTGATFTTMITGDDLTVTNTTGTMTNKNAGDKSVDLGTLLLGGADAQNYFVNDNSQSHTTVNIGKATLSLNVTVPDSKTYDGTVSVDAKVSADGIIQGDDVVLDLKWEYNSPNVAEADKITIVQHELSGAQAGNYQLPQDIPYSSVDGSITAKDVQVDFVTDAPYIFDGTDQSDSVSATITDVNGNKIDLVIDWNGKTFVEAGSYTVTAELRPADPNYKLVNNTLTLKMFAKTDNAFVVYTDGTASIYSATIPALQGSILAAGNADGSIYTMPWGELIAKAMLSYSRHFDGGDHPGMNYGSDHRELTVTVDTLKFRPMETDNIVRDAFEHLNFRETITKPQALYLGKELFIDSNHPESDYVALFEKRSSTYSPGHEPLYVERDYSADENESMTFSSQMATLFLPGSFAKAENNSAAENYDLPIQSSAVAEKAENMKSDLEKLLDELSHVS